MHLSFSRAGPWHLWERQGVLLQRAEAGEPFLAKGPRDVAIRRCVSQGQRWSLESIIWLWRVLEASPWLVDGVFSLCVQMAVQGVPVT